MYCGLCIRDNVLVAALRKLGHTVVMVPLYLPFTLDEPDQSAGTPIFFSGINVYLDQKSALFRRAPLWLRNLFTSRKLLKWAGRRAGNTRPQAQATVMERAMVLALAARAAHRCARIATTSVYPARAT